MYLYKIFIKLEKSQFEPILGPTGPKTTEQDFFQNTRLRHFLS